MKLLLKPKQNIFIWIFLLSNTLTQTYGQLNIGDPGVIFDSSKYDSRYPQMKEWEKAGVRGGIPFLKDIRIVKTLTDGADSDAINKAINDASKQSGLVAVLLKNGTYNINKRVSMKSNVSLIGESRTGVKCIIRMNNSSAFSFYKVSKSGIYTLTIEGSWGKPKYDWNYSLGANDELRGNDNISVKFNDSQDCWLDKVNIINSAKDPVRVPANHITLRDLKVDGAHKKAGGAQGYFFIQGAYNLITGCEVTHLRHISLQGSKVEYNVVYDNNFRQEVSFHSGDNGNNLIENNRITLPFDMPNSKADTPNAVYNNSREPNYYAIMGPWSTQHQNSKKPNFIYKNRCLEENHNNMTPWSDPNLLYKGPRQVKPSNPATNFPPLQANQSPKGGTLYPVVLEGNNTCDNLRNVIASQDVYLQSGTRFNSGELRVESRKRVSYLQFTVPAVTENVTSTKLKLTVSTDGGNGLIEIFKGNSDNWTEGNLSNSNKPSEGAKIGSLNTTYRAGQSYQWELSGITPGETVSLIIKQTGGNDVSFSSKEGIDSPELVFELECEDKQIAKGFKNNLDVKSIPVVKVYPNPAKDFITISDVIPGESIIIYDILGKVLIKQVSKNKKGYLDVSLLKPGLYVISVANKSNEQFIKE
ncbi:T9SS type A sorting domain-containing protein [Aquimarina algiphila]|uniref:CBM96 family carbohydrate-binding protein n=1 Tax=Aquimarina algiphila TaxID=2047982 RepID=UPI00232AB988|nr:T9SS type A sorting domain-containing protein [Aquimarina algiphila]